jgi:ATP-dependent protease Clp ATPase subunit
MTNVPQARYCSFCSRSEREVEWLVMGISVAICDRCVADAAEIIAGKRRDRALEREAERCAFCQPAPVRPTEGATS